MQRLTVRIPRAKMRRPKPGLVINVQMYPRLVTKRLAGKQTMKAELPNSPKIHNIDSVLYSVFTALHIFDK